MRTRRIKVYMWGITGTFLVSLLTARTAGGDEFARLGSAELTQIPVELPVAGGVLHGVIDMPSGKGPFPMAIIIAGSGPTDRDGNQPNLTNDCLKLLGSGLAKKGIASLRYDKRGVGLSAAAATAEEALRFETLVADAAGWLTLLRQDRRFTRIAVIGHSEGSLIGMMAAREARAQAFVSLAGAGRGASAILREQLERNLAGVPELRAESARILDELCARRRVANVPPELAAVFRPSVQPYLISWFHYEPTAELAKLSTPVLIVQGTTDAQVTIDDAARLAAARKGSQQLVLANMNHVLKRAVTPAEQNDSYSNPRLPVDPRLVDGLATFLLKHLDGGRRGVARAE
ncbi:MAG: alpha/beta hydrolase family protein [Planctomycetota bacterium]